jgi:hypothetical protein
MSTEERELALRQKHRRQNNLDKIPASLGDARGLIPNSTMPGKVYVMVPAPGGSLERRSVWASAKYFTQRPGTPVQLEYNKDDELRIAEPDTKALVASGGNPVAEAQRETSGSTPQGSLETLRLVAKGGMLVSLKGWNVIANGTFYPVSYPDIDLTSHVPAAVSGVDQKGYVGLFVLADLTGVAIVDGTPRAVSDLELGPDDVNELLTLADPQDTPARALTLVTGQTEISQNQIDTELYGDLRQVVNNERFYHYTPSGTADTVGLVGDRAWDDSYLYIKTGAGWKRTALSTF